ncbi:zinc finger protein 558-like isoform X2 [Ambystoma mexicanum]|uniref:zinc finger protein 558-like isoform X2 n=1 Tax=Ambystoma mexicanum TaxID=8296 RepID=UPI0037E9A5FA
MSLKEQAAFHDASACFSEEEWKLLQEWQKDLYRSVMKEIHQALISLGPLIASTVCSLKSKEKAELCLVDTTCAERKQVTLRCPSDPMGGHGDLLNVASEEALYRCNPHDSEGVERNDCLQAGFPFPNSDLLLRREEGASVYMGHVRGEAGESSIDPSAEYEVLSFRIKDEAEPYCTDPHDRKTIASISCHAGNAPMKRQHKERHPVKSTGKATLDRFLPGRIKARMVQGYEKGQPSGSQLWPDVKLELCGENTTARESCFSGPAPLGYPQEIPKLQGTFNECDVNPHNVKPFKGPQNIQKTLSPYSCLECKKTFGKKKYLTEHKRTHMAVRPFSCTECEKSFRRKYSLLVHKRTHTGERPYHCTLCGKNFTQKGALNRHKRAHIGERPYHCTQCKKSFSQNGILITHMRTHNHPRNKCLSQV